MTYSPVSYHLFSHFSLFQSTWRGRRRGLCRNRRFSGGVHYVLFHLPTITGNTSHHHLSLCPINSNPTSIYLHRWILGTCAFKLSFRCFILSVLCGAVVEILACVFLQSRITSVPMLLKHSKNSPFSDFLCSFLCVWCLCATCFHVMLLSKKWRVQTPTYKITSK